MGTNLSESTIKIHHILSRKYIRKHHLQNGGHFLDINVLTFLVQQQYVWRTAWANTTTTDVLASCPRYHQPQYWLPSNHQYMMTSSNGNIFRVTDPLCGKFTGHRKGQWHGAVMFSLIYAWTNCLVNTRDAGDSRSNRVHYDVIVMIRHPNFKLKSFSSRLAAVFVQYTEARY